MPGLRLVGVADEVVRLGRLAGDRRPLPAGRERRAAATDEVRRGHLVDDLLRADRAGALERPEAAVGAVVVERRRVDDADAGEEAEAGLAQPAGSARSASSGPPDRSLVPSRAAMPAASTGAATIVCRLGRRRRVIIAAGARSQRPRHGDRSHVRSPSALGAPSGPDRPLEIRAQLVGAGEPAGEVVADVGDDRRPGVVANRA